MPDVVRPSTAPNTPVAPTLSMVQIPRALLRLAKRGAWLVVFVVLALLFTPWQQSAPGMGRVIAFSPVEREQLIEAPIEGRIMEWRIVEGERVVAGDVLAVIQDNDPEIMDRLQREWEAIAARMEAAERQVQAYESQIEALTSSQGLAQQAAEAKIRMAQNKVKAAENKVKAAEATFEAARLHFDRQKQLEEEGLASRRTFELARASRAKEQTSIYEARADLEAAKADVLHHQASREKYFADDVAKIQSTRSSLAKAQSEIAKAQEELAKVEVRLNRQQRMIILAPRDGIITRVLAREGGEFVKSGDALALLVPDTDSRAVELWVTGNDAALITAGRHVRIQFEGWPAIQFTGWPSVAIGTFGGTVAFVDAAASTKGRFRAVVVPGDEPWPSARFLRQGVRANGWVMLNQVSLGYEVWRQLNGFPPVIASEEPESPLAPKSIKLIGKDPADEKSGKKDDNK